MSGSRPVDDEPDLGVFVTHEVLLHGMPILWVEHDQEGDWGFGSVAGFEVNTTSLVHLSHVVADHPGIAALADLPRGWRAERRTADEPWLREPASGDED